jgi:hypothetical protein
VPFVPGVANCIFAKDKIVNYLLSESHPQGKSKCKFFNKFGFSPNDPEKLEFALQSHPVDHEFVKAVWTDFGLRYEVECSIRSPDGRDPCVVSVWQENKDGLPAFITAYPKKL